MDPNPYESPSDSTAKPGDSQLARIGCLAFFALGALFLLSLLGELVFELIFPADEPEPEPYFEPIPMTRTNGADAGVKIVEP